MRIGYFLSVFYSHFIFACVLKIGCRHREKNKRERASRLLFYRSCLVLTWANFYFYFYFVLFFFFFCLNFLCYLLAYSTKITRKNKQFWLACLFVCCRDTNTHTRTHMPNIDMEQTCGTDCVEQKTKSDIRPTLYIFLQVYMPQIFHNNNNHSHTQTHTRKRHAYYSYSH